MIDLAMLHGVYHIPPFFPQAIDYDNLFSNTKYCVITLVHEERTTDLVKRIIAAKDIEELWYVG